MTVTRLSGTLSYSEGPLVDGTLNIVYSLPDGGSLNFTGYSDFYFDVLAIDGSGGFDVKLTLEDQMALQFLLLIAFFQRVCF